MIRGIDHLVILVQRLDDAIEAYTRLGFQVVPGGEHPGGTHNALVGFADGAYLELIAFQEPERPHDHRWYHFLRSGGGLIDFALLADDVEAELARARDAGLDYNQRAGARRRPDGQEIAWRMAWPPASRTGELPFLIDDVTPRALRVPSGEQARHANGVTGVQSLVVAVRDLDEASAEFAGLLGVTPAPGDPALASRLSAETRTVQVGRQAIVLAYPTRPSSPVAARIQRLGDGPFEVVLTAEGAGVPRPIVPEAAEGVRFSVAPGP